ncbi:bifunctional diaminohydroxyphosphoribosylaminopyrimidine deaminase/5-amino-6-(5-phosphoribosylamino)uracil reductase RibD [Flavobacterium algicola]|uniref:bifunctional diaminohydroxyphosphoribosylaminopyrimidine deaminase/5-amino-6-(5-phosphoribosylamino)uracil reductase RibD n=1 Tax=Flavobacterium algicola TaxID=556529 RepID=UPI001EFD377C|nr:bifunctional diaminohydroxyphosphoribosylaminopyrimidine deaminase/5-amino-6-(5-phosphoribosylamino)uracil reductase RibD [Flavobacterium algicola]MCG9793202.1 bifunctional diaminohydroxyphosphoribosylaminopyrimidine deaminase/5-amino-6-(5-phosphoribosylamino)uracil reductase RibD [Flavobacterium algicola]
MNTNEKYIQRCIDLAENGRGTTYPNPMVGSVIVYNDSIIGEGWHRKAGEGHAEVNAVQSVKDKSLLAQATIYVSLEPCSHFGKTPPCCDLIIANKIPNVVIGTIDPNSQVAGSGIKKLIDAGVNVTVGVLEEKCNELNKRFFTFHRKKRPYIILKWAETQNGFIAPLTKNEQKPVWITSQYTRQLVHKWRSEEQSILIGTQTAIDDNPKLDVRDWTGKNPIRVVLDRKNRIPKNSNLFDNSIKTIVICESLTNQNTENCIFECIDFEKELPSQIMKVLYKFQIQSVIIEGGRHILQSFIEFDLWDEAFVFKGTVNFENGKPAPILTNYSFFDHLKIGQDELKTYKK